MGRLLYVGFAVALYIAAAVTSVVYLWLAGGTTYSRVIASTIYLLILIVVVSFVTLSWRS